MKRLSPLLLSLGLALSGSVSVAEIEDGLYGAAVPADAIFVRQLGGLDAPVTVFGTSLGEAELPEAVYVAIPASALDGVTPGGHYTVITGADGAQIIEEPGRDDPAKVNLFVLNTGAAPAGLAVADGGPTVIAPTPAGAMATRAVNPLSVTLAVETGEMSESFDVVLRRGVDLTFWVSGDGVTLIEHQFGPVLSLD